MVTAASSNSPYGLREKVNRVLWGFVQATAFRMSFHSWYGWRRRLLVLFGASLEADVRIRRTVRIECPWNLSIGRDSAVGDHTILYCLGPVRIGNRVAISQGAHICAGTHDYRFRSMPLVRASITILDDAWICADAFVGPGVVVHEGTILGARAVAMRSLEPWSIYLGNPAVLAKQRPRFSE
jgi:putative colanic acid biosynthesis acetyltransferase WcaF